MTPSGHFRPSPPGLSLEQGETLKRRNQLRVGFCGLTGAPPPASHSRVGNPDTQNRGAWYKHHVCGSSHFTQRMKTGVTHQRWRQFLRFLPFLTQPTHSADLNNYQGWQDTDMSKAELVPGYTSQVPLGSTSPRKACQGMELSSRVFAWPTWVLHPGPRPAEL